MRIGFVEVSEGVVVAAEAEAADDAEAGGGGVGMGTEGFAGVDIGNMDLDSGEAGASDGVAEGDTGMGKSAEVEDEAVIAGIGPGGDLIDEGTFVVGLKAIDIDLKLGGEPGQLALKVLEGGGAVDFWLAFSEAVEVGAVENADGFHSGIRGGRRCR